MALSSWVSKRNRFEGRRETGVSGGGDPVCKHIICVLCVCAHLYCKRCSIEHFLGFNFWSIPHPIRPWAFGEMDSHGFAVRPVLRTQFSRFQEHTIAIYTICFLSRRAFVHPKYFPLALGSPFGPNIPGSCEVCRT